MADKEKPIVIKKYANRRLYNTGTSTYVTLDDLSTMVKGHEDFVVRDAKTGDDITHSVLTQIIFDLENKTGQSMLPIPFLRQLIAYYGDSMQMFLPSYLEQSMRSFAERQEQIRSEFRNAVGSGNPVEMMGVGQKAMEEQAKRNMEMFQKAMRMFNPFLAGPAGSDPSSRTTAASSAPTSPDTDPASDPGEIDEMKREIAEMRARLERIPETK